VIHGGMRCDLIQGQGQDCETFRIRNSSITKVCLLPNLSRELVNDY